MRDESNGFMESEVLRDKDEVMSQLREEVKSHDWWHTMSDDHRAWQRGHAEFESLRNLLVEAKKGGFIQEARDLYYAHAPWPDPQQIDKTTNQGRHIPSELAEEGGTDMSCSLGRRSNEQD